MEHLPQRTALAKRGQQVQLLVIVCLAIVYLASIAIPLHRAGGLFWDAQVYSRGIDAYRAGDDPYQHLSQLNFVYPPLFLHAGAVLFRVLPFRLLAGVYLVLSSVAVFLLPIVLVRGYLRSSWLTLAAGVLLFFFHPRMTAQDAFLSANMSSLLYCAALAAGISGLRHNRWLLFYAAVGCASIVKPPLLCLLLIPFFLGVRQLLPIAITVVVSLLEKLLERLLWPAEYKAFVDAVSYQLVTLKDNGIGLTRYFVHFNLGARVPLLHDSLSYVMHFCVIGVLVLGLWLLRARRGLTIPEPVWVSMVLVTAILASPRVLSYDVDVAILPATILVVEGIAAALARRTNPLFVAAPILGFLILLTRSATAAVFFYLLGSAVIFLAGLYRSPREDPSLAGAIN